VMGRRKARAWSLVEGFMGQPKIAPGSIYEALAHAPAAQLEDAAFGGMYAEIGRPSYPPSLMIKVLLLAIHDRASDEEAEQRCLYDLRWKYALGLRLNEDGPDKTTLCRFRARLLLHQRAGEAFFQVLRWARAQGVLADQVEEVVDSTAVHGAGAVQDTLTLIRKAIRKVARTVEAVPEHAEWAKGVLQAPDQKPKIEWNDVAARRRVLNELVEQGRAALERMAGSELSTEQQQARDLLQTVLGQDVEADEAGGVRIRQGVAKDRVCSVTDPEMRHGHKTSSGRFDGHKAEVGVDRASDLVTHAEVLAGNAADGELLGRKIVETEEAVGVRVAGVMGDTAYGRPAIRETMRQQGRDLVAPVLEASNRGLFTKDAFAIDLAAKECVCPAGQRGRPQYTADRRLCGFRFQAKTCEICPLRSQCTTSRHGRVVSIRADEADYRALRAEQHTPEWQATYRQRARIERTVAELVRYGIRRARYIGRGKTELQLLMTALLVNLQRLAKRPQGGTLPACAF
jgi:IS5 family transposase